MVEVREIKDRINDRIEMRPGGWRPWRRLVCAMFTASVLVGGPNVQESHAETPTSSGRVGTGASPAIAPVATPPSLSVRRDQSKSELPFFKRNTSVVQKIREERAIVVSVKREDLSDDLMRFTMLGAGHVSRPMDFCFRLGQQYHRLLKISDHFKTVSADAATNQVFIVTEALGYQARMLLQVAPVSEDWRSEIQWKVVWGHFKGMTGVIGFEKLPGDKTEVSVNAKYEAKELPVPKILMGFALEVITQKVAEKMRSYLESQPLSAVDEPPPVSSKGPLFGVPTGNSKTLPTKPERPGEGKDSSQPKARRER